MNSSASTLPAFAGRQKNDSNHKTGEEKSRVGSSKKAPTPPNSQPELYRVSPHRENEISRKTSEEDTDQD